MRLRITIAFAIIYVLWGSTFLAIQVALETLPPFLMAAARFLVAGILLLAWARRRGGPWPGWLEWRTALLVGGLMLLGGNGGVVWAEQRVPSGLASLVVASSALWMVLLDWRWRGSVRPSWGVFAGIAVGFAGVGVLIGPGQLGGGRVDPLGALALLASALFWSIGSIASLRARHTARPLEATAMQMLCGGTLLLLFGTLVGDWSRLDLAAITTRSVAGLGYLIVGGSLMGYTAYVWLLRVSTPARVATTSYVNPVVAVMLGWSVAGEPLTPRTVVASVVIVLAVALITVARDRRICTVAPGLPGESGGAAAEPGDGLPEAVVSVEVPTSAPSRR